ncbi:MAG: NADH-quinone oxidoreductase subunit C [Leptothrix ochracea]|uniref:NADH-quinone oxidoreductase subunit C n=1 Tax=Leptothrix ochracea TaxID=735331 RepID=UPI0034E2AD6B
MTQKLQALTAALENVLGERIVKQVNARGEITITVSAEDYQTTALVLQEDHELAFEQLIDLCGVDYGAYKDEPWEGLRYCVVLHLLSIRHNWRLRLKVFCADNDFPRIPSVNTIWGAANWFEREAFDMYGIIFEGHEDLRRILTDYGFIGHPMRKDFPVTGHVEMRYDPEQKRVIYQPVSIETREITPRIIREDNYGGLH